jgi:cell division protein FtsB
MDFRLKSISKIREFPSKEAGLRQMRAHFMGEHAAQAEAVAESLAEKASPLLARMYAVRRRVATITVAVLAIFLFVHVMFGANGMIVYKQKRDEYQALQKKLAMEQKENDLYTRQIQGLKTDEKSIEKEAREQLHYARPGEYVYVPPAPANTPPPASHSARK